MVGPHRISDIGPVVVSCNLRRKLIINPKYSLKHLKVRLQTEVHKMEPRCETYTRSFCRGWKSWLESMTSHTQIRRDTTGSVLGGVGTGLGVLNTIDQEVLAPKLGSCIQCLNP